MKQKLFLLIVVLSTVIILDGCKKSDDPAPTPVADFSYSGADTYAPATVQFTSTSTNATSYSWDFGDNGTSTSLNPQHTYSTGGDYTVSLAVSGEGGNNTITKSVNIKNDPEFCTIQTVRILYCPLTDSSGAGWDATDAPDFYILCTPGFDESSNYQLNYVNFPLSWYEHYLIYSSNFSTQSEIQIWDHDFYPDSSDYVSSVFFKLSDYTTGSNRYPDEFIITNGNTQMEIFVDWQ